MKITGKAMLALIEQAVEERGADWVYPDTGACAYWWDGDPNVSERLYDTLGDEQQPACLVGWALYHSTDNVPLRNTIVEVMSDYNEESIDSIIRHDWLVMRTGVVLTDKALAVAKAAQEEQDAGHTWGVALEKATAKYLSLSGDKKAAS
jgi:hypothetical protein